MSLSTTSNQQLSYKELQAALRTAKEQGLTSIKLNSKHCVLQEEYDRLTSTQPVEETKHCDTSNGNASTSTSSSSIRGSSYPFCSNTVKVKNKPTVEETKAVNVATIPRRTNATNTSDQLYTTRVIPAMDNKYAPSWLCKSYTVYIIDGVDYLPHELEMNLQGQCCELIAVVNEEKLAANLPPRLKTAARKDRVSKARPVTAPIVNVSKELPKAKLTFKAQEQYNPYFIDTAKAARYSKSLGDVEKQAARNLEDAIRATKQGLRNVIDFGKGFHARQVERASKAA